MKVCLVNIKNCIDYSQYGPFLFEYIKNGKCVIYNSANDSCQLSEIYEDILSDYNRNAFGAEKIKLIFFIPRNMDVPDVVDYEFYNDINIYMHIISKMNIFSEIATIYVDNCRESVQGKEHRQTKEVSGNFYSADVMFEKYLPLCREKFMNKAEIQTSVEKITDSLFKQFFEQVLEDIPEKLDGGYGEQMANVFSSKCAEKIPVIVKKYELINPYDIADSILKTIKIVYFVRNIIEKPESKIDDFDSFTVDYDSIRRIIATYKNRLKKWLNSSFDKEYQEVDSIKVFENQSNVVEFIAKIDKIIQEHLKGLDKLTDGSMDVVRFVFDKITDIVRNAKDEMHRFVQKDVNTYYDENNYSKEKKTAIISNEEEDEEKHAKELKKKLNQYSKITLPGFTEQLRLEQRLENVNRQIEELMRCKRNYSFKAFLGTFLFAGMGVALLYLLAQFSVFIKENSLWVFCVYNVIVLSLFFTSYAVMSVNYKQKILKLLKMCKIEVGDFLENYKTMAEEFEKNINLMAEYACFQEYLNRKKYIENLRKNDMNRYNWHKRKVREILDNLAHFNDFINGATPARETEVPSPADFEHDAEHTEFYQMKIF